MNVEFKDHLRKYLSDKEIDALVSSFSSSDEKAIYLNEEKLSKDKLLSFFPNLKPHPVVPNGFLYDKNEYELGKKVYHELGAYYIQEPSAMMVAHFLDPKPNEVVLDLCAAPGGKCIQTTLKMNNSGMLIANDLSKSRANILLSNIERLGISNAVVTSLDFKNHYKSFINYFDKIILDAPCSGSGMFRKSDEMKADWTYEKVLKNAEIQKQLINMCYQMLKPGGKMVYSTCSYSFEEDEEVIEYLLDNTDAILEEIPHFEGEYRSKKYKETVHLFPSIFKGEGHYISLIKKPGEAFTSKQGKIVVERNMSTKGGNKQIDVFEYSYNLPKNFENYALRPGLFLGSKISNKIIPSHHLSHTNNDLVKVSLNKEELIKYLKGESLNKKCPDGYLVVTYEDINVGLVHSVNGVLKNLYPKGLRISASIDKSF